MLPFLNSGNKNSKKYVVNFRGLNLSEGYQEGDFSDCKNISSALAPCVTQRSGRAVVAEYSAPAAIHAKDKLFVINGTQAIYDGKVVGTVNTERKQIVNVGKYIIIYPDKLCYNTEDGTFGSMDIVHNATKAVFTHNTITVTGAAWKFRRYDAVTISGCTKFPENNQCIIVQRVEGDTLTFYDNSFKVHGEVAEGETAPTSYTEEGALSFTRIAPEMDYICESGYRLMGCKGSDIFISAWNDPFNFQSLEGLAGSSYNIAVGTDGEWTGCAAYSSHVCFFKEHHIHKLYGNKPTNFQVITTQAYGVQKGSERSICSINETLFYKGVNGVYAYSGGVPELISGNFGTKRFSDACATSDGDRYYISMRHGDEWKVYVYDVLRGIWLAEDDVQCVDMAFHNGCVHMLCADGKLLRVDETLDRSDVEWSATLCPFNETMNERKGYSKFHLRMELAAGAWLTVEVKRDNAQRWDKVYTTHNERARTISIPVLPARCDSVEIRISGKGECLLRTFIREFFAGSDV